MGITEEERIYWDVWQKEEEFDSSPQCDRTSPNSPNP